jgi:glycosyltransferase involved in cell wall biosynthesis
MSRQPQVLFMGEYAFPDGDAAATRVFSLARITRDLGFCTTVIGKGRMHDQDFSQERGDYRVEDIRYITMNPAPVSLAHRVMHPIERLKLYVSTLESIDLENVRAVIVNASGSAMHVPAIRAFCRRRGLPLVLDVCEWYDPRQFQGGILNPSYAVFCGVFRFLFPSVPNMIVVSQLLQAHFEGAVRNIVRIAAPFDVASISCVDESPGDRIVLAYAGSPGRKDMFRELFLAAARLQPEERSRLELRLIGPTREEIIKELGASSGVLAEIAPIVTVLGRLPRQRVLEELRRAHFSVLLRPNRRYANAGFPSKVAESLAAGVPVLANYTSDLGEVLGDGKAGIRVDSITAEGVLTALRRALRLSPDELKAMRISARAKAELYFDYRRSLGEMRQVIARAG